MFWKWNFRRDKENSTEKLKGESEKIQYEEYELGDVCNFTLGVAFRTTDFKTEGTPIIKMHNIQKGVITLDKVDYCDKQNFPKATVVNPGDIVISVLKARKSEGKVGINLTDQSCLFSSIIAKVSIISDKIDSYYLYHWLRGSEEFITSYVKKNFHERTDLGYMKKVKILLPPLEIQKMISKKLNVFQNLEIELSKTIRERRQQYEYYRNLMIHNSGKT